MLIINDSVISWIQPLTSFFKSSLRHAVTLKLYEIVCHPIRSFEGLVIIIVHEK